MDHLSVHRQRAGDERRSLLMGWGRGANYVFHDIHTHLYVYEDPLSWHWAQTETPMLMLQGGLDIYSPIEYAEQWPQHFFGENQHFILFADATHDTSGYGTRVSNDVYAESCGLNLLVAFFKDPAGPLDTSCTQQVKGLDFGGNPQITNYFLGTSNAWD